MGIESLLGNKIITGGLLKVAKKAFKEDGLTMLAVAPDKDGNLTVTPYKEPVVVITAADKAKYDNLILKLTNERKD